MSTFLDFSVVAVSLLLFRWDFTGFFLISISREPLPQRVTLTRIGSGFTWGWFEFASSSTFGFAFVSRGPLWPRWLEDDDVDVDDDDDDDRDDDDDDDVIVKAGAFGDSTTVAEDDDDEDDDEVDDDVIFNTVASLSEAVDLTGIEADRLLVVVTVVMAARTAGATVVGAGATTASKGSSALFRREGLTRIL